MTGLSRSQRHMIAGIARHARTYRRRLLYPFIGRISGRQVRSRRAAAEAVSSPVVSLRLLYGHFVFARQVGKFVGYDRVCLRILDPFDPDRPEALWREIPDGTAFFPHYRAGCRERGVKVHPKIDRALVPAVYDMARAHSERGLFDVWGRAIRRTGRVRPLFDALVAVGGIGEKIAAYTCRDVVHIAGMERCLEPDDLPFIQAIDIWVGRAAQVIWPDLVFGRTPRRVFRDRIAAACHEAGVSGAAFNQGAWTFGSQVVGKARELPDALRAMK